MRYIEKLSWSILALSAFGTIMQAAWMPPTQISSPCVDSLTSKMAVNVANVGGNIFAVWPQFTGLYRDWAPFPIFASSFNSNTQTWLPVSDLIQLGQNNYGEFDPKVAFDQLGNGLFICARGTNEQRNGVIVALRYVDGDLLDLPGYPQELSVAGPYALAPQMAMSPDGDALVVWPIADIDSFTCSIQAARYLGSTHDWVRTGSGAIIIKTIASNIPLLDPYIPYPRMGMDSNHRAVIVWAQLGYTPNPPNPDIYTSTVFSVTYNGSDWASWTPPTKVQLSVLNGYWPDIAMNLNGDATVIWAATTTTNPVQTGPFTIQAVRYDAVTQDYVKIAGNIVIKDLETGVVPKKVARAQVAIDPLGNSIIVWDNVTGGPAIKAIRYPVTTPWATWVVPVSTQIIADDVQLPTVAMDANGNAVAAWMLFVSPYNNLVMEAAAYNRITDSWSGSTIITDDQNHDVQYWHSQDDWPQVIYDLNGNAFATWTESDGRVWRVNVAQYQPSVKGADGLKVTV